MRDRRGRDKEMWGGGQNTGEREEMHCERDERKGADFERETHLAARQQDVSGL